MLLGKTFRKTHLGKTCCPSREALAWNLVSSVGSRVDGDVFNSLYATVHRWRCPRVGLSARYRHIEIPSIPRDAAVRR